MVDLRNKKLAAILIDYSLEVKAEEKVLITCSSAEGLSLAKEVYKQALLKKAYPYLRLSSGDLDYFYFKNANQKQLKAEPEISLFLADWADKFATIVAEKNDRQLYTIDPKKILLKTKARKPVQDIVLQKRWVLTYYPTSSFAQTAKLSLEELEEVYYSACLKNWKKKAGEMSRLKKVLDGAKKVRVVGEQTDICLSFIGREFKICAGKYNMPDGEVFSAPLENKTEGKVYFDLPCLRQGKEVEGASFVFKKGKVVDFDAQKGKEMVKQSLAIDKGAKRLGEFAFGLNYGIKKAMFNTLFDEKIGGTIHMALGNAYPEKEPGGGKNDSAIHWDFVKDMRQKGSKVVVDGRTVFKEGKIVL